MVGLGPTGNAAFSSRRAQFMQARSPPKPTESSFLTMQANAVPPPCRTPARINRCCWSLHTSKLSSIGSKLVYTSHPAGPTQGQQTRAKFIPRCNIQILSSALEIQVFDHPPPRSNSKHQNRPVKQTHQAAVAQPPPRQPRRRTPAPSERRRRARRRRGPGARGTRTPSRATESLGGSPGPTGRRGCAGTRPGWRPRPAR